MSKGKNKSKGQARIEWKRVRDGYISHFKDEDLGWVKVDICKFTTDGWSIWVFLADERGVTSTKKGNLEFFPTFESAKKAFDFYRNTWKGKATRRPTEKYVSSVNPSVHCRVVPTKYNKAAELGEDIIKDLLAKMEQVDSGLDMWGARCWDNMDHIRMLVKCIEELRTRFESIVKGEILVDCQMKCLFEKEEYLNETIKKLILSALQ